VASAGATKRSVDRVFDGCRSELGPGRDEGVFIDVYKVLGHTVSIYDTVVVYLMLGASIYCVLESDGWTLSLVVVPVEIAATIQLTAPARARDDVPVKLAFDVRSVDDLRVPLTKLGGQIDPDTAPWDFRGLRHCDVVDPEGNVVQLREPLAGPA
jgi:hypothetical protein